MWQNVNKKILDITQGIFGLFEVARGLGINYFFGSGMIWEFQVVIFL